MFKTQNSLELIGFSRWSRKGYAVFSSMGKCIKVCALSAAYLLVFNSVKAQDGAEDAVADQVKLDEVVVSASRSPKMLSELARMVEVMPKQEIKEAPANSINELLENALNLDIRQRGAGDVQADLSFRGGSFNQSLVLLNGAKLISPQTGHHKLNLPINLTSLDKVEILHGPGAKFFGVNSTNGAINFITNPKSPDQFSLSYTKGVYETSHAGLNMNYRIGEVYNFLSFGNQKSDGFEYNTDYDVFNAFMTNYLSTSFGDFLLQNGYVNKKFGASTFYHWASKYQYEEIKSYFGNLQYKLKLGENSELRNSTAYRYHFDNYQFYRESFFDENRKLISDTSEFTLPGWYKRPNYHQTQTVSNELQFSHKSALGYSHFSYEYRNTGILSTNLGEKNTTPQKIMGVDKGKAQFTNEFNRVNHALMFEQEFEVTDNLDLSVSAVQNFNTDYGNSTLFSADAAFKIPELGLLYASYSQSVRLPTFTELFLTTSTDKGNKDLKAVESTTYELGYKYATKVYALNIAGYYRASDNLIDWVQDSTDFKLKDDKGNITGDNKNYHAVNTQVNAYGVEVSNKFRFQGHRFGVNYAFNNSDFDSKTITDSRYVGDFLQHKLSVTTSLKLPLNFRLNTDWNWQKRQGNYLVRGSKGSVSKDYEPFALLDTRLAWAYSKYTVYAEASNLLDTDYVDVGGVNQPGIWLRLGFKYKLSF